MKKAILISLGIASGVVWLVFCLAAVGLLVYMRGDVEPLPSSRGAEGSSDYEYLLCVQDILVSGSEIGDDISDAAAYQFPTGFCVVISDIRAKGLLSELKRRHLTCPTPANERLQAMRSHIDISYDETLFAVELYAQYCTQGDWLNSDLMDQAMAHVQGANWHMSQANQIIQSFYPDE